MNASLKTLLITAALSGLLGGTPARAEKQSDKGMGVNPFVQAAAEQTRKENVTWNTQTDTMPTTNIAKLVNPFVQAAAGQSRGVAQTSSNELVDTTARTQIPHVNPFVQAAREQSHRDNAAAETRMTRQARLMH